LGRGQVTLLDRLDHADYGVEALVRDVRVTGNDTPRHPLPERAQIRPETLRQPSVDDDRVRRAWTIRAVELAPLEQSDPHRPEIVGADPALDRRDQRLAGLGHVTFREDHAVRVVTGEGELNVHAGSGDTGCRAHLAQQLVDERTLRVGVRITTVGQREMRSE